MLLLDLDQESLLGHLSLTSCGQVMRLGDLVLDLPFLVRLRLLVEEVLVLALSLACCCD